MENILKKIAKLYFTINKSMNYFVTNVVLRDLDKEVRNFKKRYKYDPSEADINDLRKNIVMRFGIKYFALVLVAFYLIKYVFLERLL